MDIMVKKEKGGNIRVRGYQKKVIFLKDTGSHLFDEAYFVVSRKGEEANVEQSDMVFEANRIIKESLENKESRIISQKKKNKIGFIIPFISGVFSTLITIACVYFIIIQFLK